MATVNDVLKATMQSLIVAGAEVSIDPADAEQFIFRLNNHMSALIGDGLTITWTAVSGTGDTITIMNQATTPVNISNYCIQYLENKMAELMAPDHGVSITPTQQRAMRDGERSMLRMARKGTHIKYPTTLPKGSGNTDGGYLEDPFFDGATAGEIS